MAKSPPSFPLYYTNWIEGTDELSDTAYRCYLRLLIRQWTHGCIPETKLLKMNICKITELGYWESIWDEISHKFVTVDCQDIFEYDGRKVDGFVLVNPRMHTMREKEVPKYRAVIAAAQKNGRLGGRPKKKPRRNPVGTPEETQWGTQSEPSLGKGKGDRGSIGSSTRTENVLTVDETLFPNDILPKAPTESERRSKFTEIFNSTVGVKKCEVWSDKRKSAFRARIAKKGWVDLAVKALGKFPLNNGYQPTIDQFLRPDTAAEIVEGKHDFSFDKSRELDIDLGGI